MTNRLSDYWPADDASSNNAQTSDADAIGQDASETGLAATQSFGCDDLPLERILDFTGGCELNRFDARVNDESPSTLSFSEWAPRVRAERRGRRIAACGCGQSGKLCRSCRGE